MVPLLSAALLAQTSAPQPKAPATAAQPAVTVADFEALKDALAAQQRQIEQLQRALAERSQTVPAAQPATEGVPVAFSEAQSPTSAPVQDSPTAQLVEGGSSDQRIRNLERQIKGLGPISFSGDVALAR